MDTIHKRGSKFGNVFVHNFASVTMEVRFVWVKNNLGMYLFGRCHIYKIAWTWPEWIGLLPLLLKLFIRDWSKFSTIVENIDSNYIAVINE